MLPYLFYLCEVVLNGERPEQSKESVWISIWTFIPIQVYQEKESPFNKVVAVCCHRYYPNNALRNLFTIKLFKITVTNEYK